MSLMCTMPSKEQLVYLNIYDIQWSTLWPRKLLWILGMGVYHSGVEIYSREFSFYGHPIPMSGVFHSEPKCLGILNKICKYKTSILIGHTELSKSEVFQTIIDVGKNWQGPSYHLFSKNCNDFSENLCQVLCSKSIPGWVNRLAKFAGVVPFLDTIVPITWVQPRAQSRKPVQKEGIRVRYPDQTDDGSESDQLQASQCCPSTKCGNVRSLKKTVKKTLTARNISADNVSHNSVNVDRFDLSDSSDDEDGLILVKSPIRISSAESSRSPSPVMSTSSWTSKSKSHQPSQRKINSHMRRRNRRKIRFSRSRSKSRVCRTSRSGSRNRSQSRATQTSRSGIRNRSKSRTTQTSRSKSRNRRKNRTSQSRCRSRSRSRASRISRKQSRTRNDKSKSRSSRSKSNGSTSRKRPATRTHNSRGCKRRNLSRSQSQNRKTKSARKTSKSRPRKK